MMETFWSVLGFMAAYFAILGVVHYAVFRLSGSALLSCHIQGVIEYGAWIPFGLGMVDISNVYLLAIPQAHEFYDYVVVFLVGKHVFNRQRRRFVLGHHVSSTVARVVLTLFAWRVLPSSAFHYSLRLQLLYYCCSIFLTTPGPVVRLLVLLGASCQAQAIALTGLFACARLSHLGVLVLASQLKSGLAGISAVAFFGLVLACVALNEYHSITNNLPILRKAWRLRSNAPAAHASAQFW
jgi:hypothetical protein